MNQFAEDKARGGAAFRDGLPFDPTESVGWEIGYGNAITIEPHPEPDLEEGE